MHSRPSITTTQLSICGQLVLLAIVACVPPVGPEQPDSLNQPPASNGSLIGTTGVSALDAEELDRLAHDATISRLEARTSGLVRQHGDINQRPVHLWYLRDTEGIQSILLAGHAEDLCCSEVSKVLNDIEANMPDLTDWVSYGVTSLTAKGDPKHRRALEQLVSKMARLEQGTTCAGQILTHDVQLDEVHEFEAEIARKSARACELADEIARPVVARVKTHAIPAFVPLYRRDGTEVHFVVTESDLQLDKVFRQSLTTDPVARERREMRHMIDGLKPFVHKISNLGPTASQAWTEVRISDFPESGDVALLRAHIEAAITELQQAAEWCRNSYEVTGVLGTAQERLQRQCDDMANDAMSNEQIMASLPERGNVRVVYRKVAEILTGENPYQSERAEYQGMIERMEQQLERLERHKLDAREDDGMLVLIDAVLRGWPATFVDEALELEYDEWAVARQNQVWAGALGSLRDLHEFEGTPEDILVSNVYFTVRGYSGNHFAVTPHYVHDSDFYIICEPGDTFARYESVTADTNLFELEQGVTP